ncbi:phosphate acyltransferase [Actinobacillus succinogenes]|uniref:Phosphate acyltransferase n=1 Tax=Actinobacillus succinogenes (strain ATCC 55618 / DSM 22257 / CCUG 43843 / 130Z) TaxID=339671 RepID=PLSX_ACTSZ|nr:phosphate acyltransferase PlsX [Actinobacillus succinogenes]A6VQV3.1 RecName: Full=Phosphate acyltransferase; AltName: Full=Acyl-ACP phosphotransacylase; AltName: Full=Acyl-[acyl-carrier-protein]--phosphate acyltransferase; AltName: Full=Phosphate-acyl-ACP acyltransferase [Actinobacillus succinogenes 130Z]ABR75350.1 fatty acid/phospholipid synthesis protein PlsX [Actinobacillus succinogenes 130Z]PHI40261.1 phosphate acyltransferase [Actinobacillus succinogenes]
MSRLTLALDVMGGDIGPRITIPASLQALEKDPMLSLLLFGDSRQIQSELDKVSDKISSDVGERLAIRHASHVIDNNQSVTEALRHSKGTSMRLAIESVQRGEAQGCVSGGNTGALMGLAKVILQPLKGIQRPALVSILPTIDGNHSVMLDLGANIDCNAENLYQFALMGAIFAENQLNLVFPRVALLNIGVEAIKGYKSIREASEMIKQNTALNYIGFIEGNYLLNGIADVIVSDGFAGNVALKTLEGAAQNVIGLLKGHSRNNVLKPLFGRLMKILFRDSYQRLRSINPEQYNGASLIGLTSVVVKSHGGAGINAFSNAVKDAALQVRQQIPQKILDGLNK